MVHSAFGSIVRVFASNVCVIIKLRMFVVTVKFVRIIGPSHVLIMFQMDFIGIFLHYTNDFGISFNKMIPKLF